MKKRTALLGLVGIGAVVALLTKVEVTVVKVEKATDEPNVPEEEREHETEWSEEDTSEEEIQRIQNQ